MSTPLGGVTLAGESRLTDADFERFRELVRARTGIALGSQKRHLLRARLERRLRALGLADFAAYHAYVTDPAHVAEVETFINAITTNKTDFFREAHHFQYLTEQWVPALLRRSSRRVRLWSAACSTGEEPYTLAMTLLDAKIAPPAWDVRILASDIDTAVLEHARDGIYTADRTDPVPPEVLRRHFLRQRNPSTHVRVRDELRQLVTFRQLNLTEGPWPFRSTFDVIFCRNALIYFDRPTQQGILDRMLRVLAPGGVLFLGHSESVFGLVEGLRHLGQTIYVRNGAGPEGERS